MSGVEPDAQIHVAIEVQSDLDTVWSAWTDPAIVARWWGGWLPGKAPAMTFESELGGAWRFAMELESHVQWVGGHVTQLERPHQLGLTFAWEGADAPATPVKLAFSEPHPGRVRIELIHDQSLGGNACADGWSWSLACLKAHLEADLESESPKAGSNPSAPDTAENLG